VSDKFNQLIADKVKTVFGANRAVTALAPLAGDASSRRYYRAHLSGNEPPASIIVMELPAGSGALPLSSEELAIFKDGPKELPFLNLHRFLTRADVGVPKVYGQWEKEGILLLEDLGDIALWDRVQVLADNDVIAWYRKAIDELLKLQIRGTRLRDDSCIAFQQRFDFQLYMWEFEHFIEWALEKRPGVKVSAQVVDQLRKTFAAIAERLANQTACLNHRDYHSWNLMIHDEAIRVIDFQDALLAPPQYDLASLLNDRITDTVIHEQLETRLVRYYLDNSGALETGRHDDEFFEVYRLSAIQRDLKVVGRFYYLNLVKGKPGYMQFIPPTVRRLKRNLAKLAQTKPLLPLLLEYFEAMQ
jgi:N-acetylmuramate 1-kinase